MQTAVYAPRSSDDSDFCSIVTDRYHHIARWRYLYTALIFLVSVFIVVMAAAAVVCGMNEQWAGAISTGLASLVSGLPMRFVIKQRNQAKREEDAALADLKDACPTLAEAQKQVRAFAAVAKFPLTREPTLPT